MSPVREACDRCHAIKTRCVKPGRTNQCMRCERLGVPCTYSSPERTGRPLGRSKATHNSSNRTAPPQEKAVQHNNDNNTTQSSSSNSALDHGNLFASFLEESEMSLDWVDADTLVQSSSHSESGSNLISNAMLNSFVDTPVTITNEPVILTPRDDDQIRDIRRSPLQDRPMQHNNSEYQTLQHFTEVQTRLSRLVQIIPGSNNVLAEIEELYQIAEALSSISQTQDSAPDEHQFCNVPVMLLSSCYMTLLHTYNSLIKGLSLELQQEQNEAATASNSAPSQPASSSRERRTPSISIGNVRLSIKRQANIEINLYLAIYTLRHIRQKTQQFTSTAMMAMGKASDLRQQTNESWPPTLNVASGTTLSDQAESAMADLRQNEESLFARLGTSGSLFS